MQVTVNRYETPVGVRVVYRVPCDGGTLSRDATSLRTIFTNQWGEVSYPIKAAWNAVAWKALDMAMLR